MTNLDSFEETNNQFLKELSELLAKYNACISFSVGEGSDTHGLYNEKMIISRQPDPNSWEDIDIKVVDGWVIDSSDFN